MYITGGNWTSDDVNEYSLSTAFDVSTASYVQNFDSQIDRPRGIVFNNDGTKMFIADRSGKVNEYSLTTAFNVSTASYVQNFSVSAQENSPEALFFNNDGTKMFITGSQYPNVYAYNLSTAFDVSSASYVGNPQGQFWVQTQEIDQTGLTFNNDGTKMFVIGTQNDNVNEYNLSTAFDISTASFFQLFSVTVQDFAPSGIQFNNDGTKMFVIGLVSDAVNEYSLVNPSSPSVCVNTAINDITFNTTGATGIGTPTDLPSGVTAAWSSNVLTISGTPSVAGTYAYSVPLTGGCGSVNATGTITVTGDNTAGTASTTPTLCVNTALTNITIATTGATGIANVTDLPAGVTASWSSDVITISGTPTATGTFNYTILLTGGC